MEDFIRTSCSSFLFFWFDAPVRLKNAVNSTLIFLRILRGSSKPSITFQHEAESNFCWFSLRTKRTDGHVCKLLFTHVVHLMGTKQQSDLCRELCPLNNYSIQPDSDTITCLMSLALIIHTVSSVSLNLLSFSCLLIFTALLQSDATFSFFLSKYQKWLNSLAEIGKSDQMQVYHLSDVTADRFQSWVLAKELRTIERCN